MTIYGIIIASMIITVTMLHRHEFASNEKGIHFWKPLSSTLMTFLLLASFFQEDSFRTEYTLSLLIGILLSFGGDMSLMFMNRSKKPLKSVWFFFLRGTSPMQLHLHGSADFTVRTGSVEPFFLFQG